MARLGSKGQISGSAGPVSYTSYNGSIYVRTKPGKGNVSQTSATKNAASDFGNASKLAKAIRLALYPILQNIEDSYFYQRFTSQVHSAGQTNNPNLRGSRNLIDGDLSLVSRIDCNVNSPFRLSCSLSPALSFNDSGQLSISLPAFLPGDVLAKFDEATNATLAYLVVAINPKNNTYTHAEMFQVETVIHDGQFEGCEWTMEIIDPGQLIVVSAAVFYCRWDRLAGMVGLNSRTFHPCEISCILKS